MMPWRSSKRRLNPRLVAEGWRGSLRRVLLVEGVGVSLAIAGAFAVLASILVVWGGDRLDLRPGQVARHNTFARVDFRFFDAEKLRTQRLRAEMSVPTIFSPSRDLRGELLRELRTAVPDATANDLDRFVEAVLALPVVVLERRDQNEGEFIRIENNVELSMKSTLTPQSAATIAPRIEPIAATILGRQATPAAVQAVIAVLSRGPTHTPDETATQLARDAAVRAVGRDVGMVYVKAGQRIVSAGVVGEHDWALLSAERAAYRESLGWTRVRESVGLIGAVFLVTALIAGYAAKYHPRIVHNHGRGVALALLLLLPLVGAVAAGTFPQRLYFLAVAPLVLSVIVIAIAFGHRFAIGTGALGALLVAMAVPESIGFFLTLLSGVATASLLCGELRHRGRLIELGVGCGFALAVTATLAGLIRLDPAGVVISDAVHAGFAGLFAGFAVLGALPFIERVFRITTPMTLLELADASHPLLRKLSAEAPGTYSHSLGVATLAAEAAEAIHANALLVRVGAYYHDVGKINKPDFFIENQIPGQPNRHLTLSPNVSMLIIIAHVKDGIELAREYNLPTSLFPFIQSHHGTTLIEFFYHRAKEENAGEVSEHQFRYPGPKPRSKEVAILMLADAVESASRSLTDASPARIEQLVREIVQKRLLDGQFDECDLTMAELAKIEKSLVRTMRSVHHRRIAYPQNPPTQPKLASGAG